MPNWCNNSLTLKHKDPAMIERAHKALADGRFLQEFVPCPEELLDPKTSSFGGEDAEEKNALRQQLREKYGYESWYDWNIAHWGTKWDVGGDDGLIQKLDANTVEASFESAWAPPVNAYERLCAMGFEVKAYYNESGMAFCGVVTGDEEGFDDDYREYGGTDSTTVREAVGEELDDFWCISEDMSQWEEENEDE